MNNTILLIISVTAALVGTVFKKVITNRTSDSNMSGLVFTAFTSLTAAIVLFIMNGFTMPSIFTLILALAFGAVTAFQYIANISALKAGPLSYTTVITSLSTIIPTLCGAIIWKERIVPIQIVGILLMLGCFVLSSGSDSGEKKKTLKWLIYCAILFVTTGLIGVMQKWHQSSAHKDELDAFLLIAFIFSTVFSLICLMVEYRKASSSGEKPTASTIGIGWLILILMTVCGVSVAVNNKLNLYLSGVIDSAIFFPIVNGGGLILTTLSAFIIFRERPTVKQWIGIVLGIIAVIFLCNPF